MEAVASKSMESQTFEHEWVSSEGSSHPTLEATPNPSKCTTARPRSSTPIRARPCSSTHANSPPRTTTPARKPLAPLTTSSRGNSPPLKARPSNPSAIRSLSFDASGDPKTRQVAKRPSSVSRARRSEHGVCSFTSKGNPRQESYSPPRVRTPFVSCHKNGSMSLSRHDHNDGDDVLEYDRRIMRF